MLFSQTTDKPRDKITHFGHVKTENVNFMVFGQCNKNTANIFINLKFVKLVKLLQSSN